MIIKEGEYYIADAWNEIVYVETRKKQWVYYVIVKHSDLVDKEAAEYKNLKRWAIPEEIFRKTFKRLSKLRKELLCEPEK